MTATIHKLKTTTPNLETGVGKMNKPYLIAQTPHPRIRVFARENRIAHVVADG